MGNIGKRLKKITLQVSLILGPTFAIAEVCDKEVPSWNPASGPVGPLEFMLNAIVSPLGILIAGLFLSGFLLRKTWTALLASAVAAFYAFAILSIWRASDGIYAASISEGCRASPALLLIVLCFFAVAFLVVAGRRYIER